jgi:uncharacterized protein (TIGR00162 family)
MDDIEIETLEAVDDAVPVLVEGLPGVGHVGKLAVEHLIDAGESTPVRRLYSNDLPPQVTVGDDGTTDLTAVEFTVVELGETRLLAVTGDHQAGTSAGHYRIAEGILSVAADVGVERAFALGGVPTGDIDDDRSVLSAINVEELRDPLTDGGAEFREGEPAGGIVGVSGLLLGLGERRELPAACLMGETSGYLVDPTSASAVIDVLEAVLDFEVDHEPLEERAEEMAAVVDQMQALESQAAEAAGDENLRYIG